MGNNDSHHSSCSQIVLDNIFENVQLEEICLVLLDELSYSWIFDQISQDHLGKRFKVRIFAVVVFFIRYFTENPVFSVQNTLKTGEKEQLTCSS